MGTPSRLEEIKVLCFDVFGTVVDWRRGIENALRLGVKSVVDNPSVDIPVAARHRAAFLKAEDFATFAAEWRLKYYHFTREIATDSSLPYKTIDEHFLESLHELINRWGLEAIWQEEDIQKLSKAWHELPPWPDTSDGIRELNKKYETATLANGNTELQQDLSASADLEWTHCFGANVFGSYKPDPQVYLGGAQRVGQPPEQCAMVAAHLGDLKAARQCGFKTIYVERPKEETWSESQIQEAKREGWVDLWVEMKDDGFLKVAQELGIK